MMEGDIKSEFVNENFSDVEKQLYMVVKGELEKVQDEDNPLKVAVYCYNLIKSMDAFSGLSKTSKATCRLCMIECLTYNLHDEFFWEPSRVKEAATKLRDLCQFDPKDLGEIEEDSDER